MREITLGFSPCPNDTFLFHALVHGRVALDGITIRPILEDVGTLNALARDGVLDVTKVSYGAMPDLLGTYALLRSGGALGRGCGPLLVAREGVAQEGLRGARVVIPGEHTTANLLLRLYDPTLPAGDPLPYDRILPAVASGEADAGLIIHESRFTYPTYGLTRIVDLGEWWEQTTGHPIPLGGIIARRALGKETVGRVERAIRDSVEAAFADPSASAAYVRAHAQELDPDVTAQHIALYVNEHSRDLGPDGEAAVLELFRRAAGAGLAPALPSPFPERPLSTP